MADRRQDLVRHLGASLSRRAGLATLAGAVAGVIGIADIDAKKKKKKKKKEKGITVCASGCKYTSLQEAVDASPAGSTICLKDSTYSGYTSIGKSLTITPCSETVPVTITAPQAAARLFDVAFSNDSDQLLLDGLVPGGLTLNGDGVTTYSGGVLRFTGNSDSTRGAVLLDNVVISGGQATVGGGIYANTTGAVHLTNSRISSCTASFSGGGIHMVVGEVIMDGTSQIDRCNSPRGAGIYLDQEAKLTLRDSAMIGGTAPEDKNTAYDSPGDGGGVYAESRTTVNMASTATIQHNVANNNGGGIFAEQDDVTMTVSCSNIGPSGNIKDNVATNGSGPQIYITNTSSIC